MMKRLTDPGPNFLTLEGRATAPGSACGPLRRNGEDLHPDQAAGTILVAERAVPADVGRILSSAGTLTMGGAVLSHVSLLSREFGKPSVSLTGGSNIRLLPAGSGALLDLADVVGGQAQPVLHERDIVIIDGDLGHLYVPGGTDRDTRRRIRAVHAALVIFGGNHENERYLDAVVEALGNDRGVILDFMLEAAIMNRVIPPGDSARRLVGHLLAEPSLKQEVAARLESLRDRIREQTVRTCAKAAMEIKATTELDDLGRRHKKLEEYVTRRMELLDDVGGAPGVLEEEITPVRATVEQRRSALVATVRREAADTLALSDEVLRPRIGGLFQLLRRARSAALEEETVLALQSKLSRFVADEKEMVGEHLCVDLDSSMHFRDRSLVGGKASGLFRVLPIIPEGCRIPRGFVVTSSAYKIHLLGETGDKLNLAASSGEDETVVSRNARAALLGAEIPDEVVEAVRDAYGRLDADRLAVRSSATIEDGPAGSLAGQFDTFLGVRGFDELLRRIRWAWASLWNAHALRTMAVSGNSPLGASQAVLVQEMVETRSAGVLFSRDPTGRPDALLVNAAWGLGEGISQGEVGGDLYWVKRSTGALIASETGRNRNMIVLDPERPGTVERELDAERSGKRCLSDGELVLLARLARSLEEATGRSQDVEFGFDKDGNLMVFQVRRVVPRG